MFSYESTKKKIICDFIELLPMLRVRLGLTQEQLGERIGTTRQTIISIENKKNPLTWSLFLAMFFLFFIEPGTRPFLLASGIINSELSKILFGDTLTLINAASELESKKPMLAKAQEMIDGFKAGKKNESEE